MPEPIAFQQSQGEVNASAQHTGSGPFPSGPVVIGGEHLSTPDRPVGNLPVYVDDSKTFWSCWALSPDEVERVQQYQCIFVGVLRPVVFPVLSVLAPDDARKLSKDYVPPRTREDKLDLAFDMVLRGSEDFRRGFYDGWRLLAKKMPEGLDYEMGYAAAAGLSPMLK